MVLHLCDDDLIASLHLRLAEGLGNEIDGLSSSTGEDDLLDLACIDELTHLFASLLMQIGGLLREIVHTTMHIGIHIEILVPHGVEHHERLLRGSRIVKIDQRLLIHLAPQDGEILAYLIYIKH